MQTACSGIRGLAFCRAPAGQARVQLFRRRSNTVASLWVWGLFGLSIAFVLVIAVPKWSTWETEVGASTIQPVPFSHEHHVGGLGIDCRYCHTGVTRSSFAGMPSSHTCMTCHSQIWQNAPMLKPVRDSFASGRAIQWNRVTKLPKYVYFDHSIHVNKGVGCTTCHGPVQDMPLLSKARSFYMRDCLGCHRHPEGSLRPMAEIFDLHWKPGPDQEEKGAALVREYHVPKERLTDCYTCHR